MTRYLLDTDVISELRRSRPHPAVAAWFEGIGQADVVLSVLTLGEIHQGIVRLGRRDPDQAAVLADWLGRLERGYADRILPVTAAVARRWAELNAVRSLPVIDSLIAATAIEHGAVLATRNVRDLAGVDLSMVNPFNDR